MGCSHIRTEGIADSGCEERGAVPFAAVPGFVQSRAAAASLAAAGTLRLSWQRGLDEAGKYVLLPEVAPCAWRACLPNRRCQLYLRCAPGQEEPTQVACPRGKQKQLPLLSSTVAVCFLERFM